MLTNKSPEYWARDATLDELQQEVQRLPAWTEETAEILDFAYVERTMRAVGRAQQDSRDAALALADHLERVAHDSARAALSALDRPYFVRWRMLAEILHRAALRLDVPQKVLDRKHVRDILVRLHAAGGRVAQGDLGVIANDGQRSATLKLMEQWELIERHADGATRIVSITELGRLAIADQIAAQKTSAKSGVQRGCMYMWS